MKKKTVKNEMLVKWIVFAAIFLLCCVMAACLFYLYFVTTWTHQNTRAHFFVTAIVCLIVINALVFFFYMKSSDNKKEIHLLKLNEAKLSEQIKAAEDIDSTYREMRRVRHDIKNQYICVRQLLKEQKYSEADAYLGNIIGETEAALTDNYCVRCGYHSVDAILNRISAKCAELNIDFSADIRVSDIGNVSEYHICSVAANLLNNALEASVREQSSRIRFTLANNQNYVVIKTENSILKSVLDSNPQLVTTKSGGDGNGFGIISVRKIASRYDGKAEFYENNGYFTAEVWLKRSEKDGL